MADKTRIEWAANADGTPGATWNPIRARDRETGRVGTFCVHATAGCVNCYAETFQQRALPNNGIGLPYTAQNLARVEHFIDENMLTAPLRRRKPTTWFLSSMTDVFGEWVPDDMLDRLFAVMAACSQHTFIVLTKRSKRMRAYLEEIFGTTAAPRGFRCPPWPALLNKVESAWMEHDPHDYIERIRPMFLQALAVRKGPFDDAPLPNVWLVVSCEDQANADERIPDLLATPAAVRGVSCEPLIGPIDLEEAWHGENALDSECWGECGWCERGFTPLHNCQRTGGDDRGRSGLDWVIAGGESGPKARPMHPDWARKLRDDCAAAGVPFFFKQWGEWLGGAFEDQADQMVFSPASASEPLQLPVSASDWNNRSFFFDEAEAPNGVGAMRYGKHTTGRLLDGRTHDERPPFSHRQSES